MAVSYTEYLHFKCFLNIHFATTLEAKGNRTKYQGAVRLYTEDQI